jgi:hypothetical protein
MLECPGDRQTPKPTELTYTEKERLLKKLKRKRNLIP